MFLSPYILFKSDREEKEWFEGVRNEKSHGFVHPALYVVVLAAARWHYLRIGQPAVVTHLLRTAEEQRTIYPGSSAFRSPHEFGRAVDLRTADLSDQDAREWEAWVNQAFSYQGREGLTTALLHHVGDRGEHLHLQVGPLEKIPQLRETLIRDTQT